MTEFVKDHRTLNSDPEKNKRLSDLVLTKWMDKKIERVERVEEGDRRGWKAHLGS